MALWLALLLALWGTVLAFIGALSARAECTESGERGVHAATLFALLAAIGLGSALATGDLTLRYVASWSSFATPLPYRIGAIWAGPSGTLLLWAAVLGAGSSLAVASLPKSRVRAWVAALLALLLTSVLAMASLYTNPFVPLKLVPDDGRGLPLEWMRPIALLQMPVGYVALSLLAVPAVLSVMGAIGEGPGWRVVARRWALVCWSLLVAAMLLDWRRRFGDGAWEENWQWAPLFDGTAFGWAGASLLVVALLREWRTKATLAAGFVAFTLGLVGLTLRRAGGWEDAYAFTAGDPGRTHQWFVFGALTLVAVAAAVAVTGERRDRAMVAGPARFAMLVLRVSMVVVALALFATAFPRRGELSINEGGRGMVRDRFGTEWTLSLESVSQVGREAVMVNVVALRAAVQGRARGYLAPAVQSLFAADGQEPIDQMREAGVTAGLAQDLRVFVTGAGKEGAELSYEFIPAATWIWIGGVAAVIAGFVAALSAAPTRREVA